MKIKFILSFFILGHSAFAQTHWSSLDTQKFIQSARSQIGRTLSYDPSYKRLKYPLGDIPISKGVCTDVIIRALRDQHIDLQELIHKDMKTSFASYPRVWGDKRPDPNIDHRRVLNMAYYFEVQKLKQDPPKDGQSMKAGDVVSCRLSSGLPHVYIVSDKKSLRGEPYVIHNVGEGVKEELFIDQCKVESLFRFN